MSVASSASTAPRLRRLVWALLAAAFAAELWVVGAPIWIIRPFRAQSPRALSLALALRASGPRIALAAAAIVILCAAGLWIASPGDGRRRWLRRSSLGLLIVLAAAGAGLARAHYFEWLFHPVADPGFIPAAQAQIKPGDIVLDVGIGGQAKAYPVLEMAYHHLVNDQLGGVPIVATY